MQMSSSRNERFFCAHVCVWFSSFLERHVPGFMGTGLAIAMLLMPVEGQAAASCSVSASNLNFGAYDTINADVATTGIVVSCSGLGSSILNYSIALSSGPASPAGSYAGRIMNSAGQQLPYNLFTSAAFASVWGDGTQGTLTVTGSLIGPPGNQSVTHTVHGQILGGQNVVPGAYSTTGPVTVTLTF
jgi:spore coat protein U-like protein